MVIDSITTGSVGRSLPSVAVLEIASTTRCDAVGARTGVGHREQIGLVELQLGVELVGELVAGSAATRPGWIATLDHEALDHPVKDRAVVERAGRAT